MLLREMFNVPAQSEWDIAGPCAEYTFHVDAEDGKRISYTIYMERIRDDDICPVEGNIGNYSFDLRMAGEIWGVEFGNDSVTHRHSITHTGKASEVFGHVAAALRKFKRSRPNAAFFFTAKEPSRKRLYDALVARLGGSRQVQDTKYPGGLRGYLVM